MALLPAARATAIPGTAIRGVFLFAVLAPWLAGALLPRVPQPGTYHMFADQRTLCGLDHALNVVSNVPFLLVGLLGLAWTASAWRHRRGIVSIDGLRAYQLLFVGAALTAFGSAWYHAAPDDARLVWDRLPMTLAFAGLLCGTASDRGLAATWPRVSAALATAAGTVLYWASTGNLTPYLAMQACYFLAVLVAIFVAPSRYTRAADMLVAMLVYAMAVVLEQTDKAVFEATGQVSGHTLKHVVAATAILVVGIMLRRRQPVQVR